MQRGSVCRGEVCAEGGSVCRGGVCAEGGSVQGRSSIVSWLPGNPLH